MKKRIKRVLAFLLTLAMCVSTTGVAAYAEETVVTDKVNTESGWDGVTTVNNYTGENFNVVFSLANYWEGGYNANVKVENTGSSVIENWYLSFALDNRFSSIWNAEVVSSENDQYVVKNANWNADIPVGGWVEFGISVNETFAGFPEEYELLGESTQVQEEAYSVEYILDNDWGTGFTARMLLTNHTETVLEDWTLEFDFDREITNIWNGVIEVHEGNHYVIKNAGYNANVVSGSAISFGFNGEGGTAEDVPENCRLFQVSDEETEVWMDSDGDFLCDRDEEEIGTNPMKADTDEDGAIDYLEVINGTNPLVPDIENMRYSNIDTDVDGLSDYEELVNYKTDPLNYDTDEDRLDDGFEVKNGLDPLVSDTDGDGIPDNEEKLLQELSKEIITVEKKEILNVSVSMEVAGDINNTTKIKNTYGIDYLSSEVVGLVGVPVDITTSSEFDKATITFTYNEEALGTTKEENLRVMWYNEENNQYVILDEETVLDTEKNVLSYTTTHFSTYLVVDRQAWYDVWSNAVTYGRKPNSSAPTQYVDLCYVIDKSGSMFGTYMSTAKESIRHFIEAMYSNDRGAIIGFDSSARVYQDFTSDKDSLCNALSSITATGGTSVESGLVKALNLFPSSEEQLASGILNKRVIVLLCDGDVYYSESTLKRAKNMGVKIFPVLLGSTYGQAKLQNLADETGGVFYYAATAEEIRNAIFGVQEDTIGELDTTDTDGDGLYDVYETVGMILPNGKYIFTDPMNPDTDGDGLSDGKEMGLLENYDKQFLLKKMYMKMSGYDSEVYAEYFDCKSIPRLKDTDGDLDLDSIDPNPFNHQLNDNFIEKISELERLAYKYNDGAWDTSNKYAVDKEYWLVMMFIRQFSDGKNGTSDYINGNWPVVGGDIDYEFVKYVYENDRELYDYFSILESIYANHRGELLDVRHFAATFTVYVYNTGLLDARHFSYQGYDRWYKVWENTKRSWKNAMTVAKAGMFEYTFNNLGGWAGDLQTLMNYTREDIGAPADYNTFYTVLYNSIGKEGSFFDMEDMYADTDSYNIFINVNGERELADSLEEYYCTGYEKRYTSFTNGWSRKTIYDLVETFTDNSFLIDLSFLQWPLFNYVFEKEESRAAATAFTDYLMDQISGE